jgi:NodT family efflux transporter outer membrane factor (OMF) lipoprotein
MKPRLNRWSALAACAALGACAVGPDYVRPDVAVPAHFKEAPDWKPAQPADAAARGPWWKIFADDDLDRLQQQAAQANQDVVVAEAHYRAAAAQVDAARASFFPTVGVSAGVTRSANATTGTTTAPYTVHSAAVTASWVPDLWGEVRRGLEQAKANEAASAGDLGAAVLSLQSTLATDYFALRVADEQQRLLEEAVDAYQKSLDLTQSRYRGGVAALTDVVQAQAQLEATRAQAIDVGITRGQMEHAIAVLLGKAPAEFSIARRHAFIDHIPEVPAQMPASLLERRPDVASAERLAAAANAQIGIAQAAYFPSLTLSATGGYRAPSGADLFSLPYRYWTLGPSLAETIFDAGARSAAKQEAIANFDAAAATYRKSVLTALQNVEDQLLALHLLLQESRVEDAAVQAAEENLRLTNNQYKAGTVSYLNVIVAQTTALTDHISALDIRGRQLAATVQLIAGLGGDWQSAAPPADAPPVSNSQALSPQATTPQGTIPQSTAPSSAPMPEAASAEHASAR